MAYKGKLDVKRMIELYNSGKEPEQIAKEFGYKNGEYITAKLRQAGVYRTKNLDKGKVYALYKAGWSTKDIAFEMDTTEKEIEEVVSIL